MTVSIDSSIRDGRLCTVTASVSSNSNATTTFDVVGNIVQCCINRGRGTDTFNLTLHDTSSDMIIFSKNNLGTADINPSQLNSGSGAYCRGPLKISAASTDSSNWTVVVSYIKY